MEEPTSHNPQRYVAIGRSMIIRLPKRLDRKTGENKLEVLNFLLVILQLQAAVHILIILIPKTCGKQRIIERTIMALVR